jgi:hypothetical protein
MVFALLQKLGGAGTGKDESRIFGVLNGNADVFCYFFRTDASFTADGLLPAPLFPDRAGTPPVFSRWDEG